MAIGDLIFNLMGRKDPRDELMQAALAGGTQPSMAVPPPAGDGTPAGAAGGPATTPAAPQQPAPQPQALTSPPDLSMLYERLLKRSDQNRLIDRGIGLIASGFAQDQNRANILQAFTGGSNPEADPGETIKMIMGLKAAQQADATRISNMRNLPAIAQKFGLSPEVAKFMMDNGQLDEFIKEASKPNREVVTLADGTKAIVDKTTATTVSTFGPKTPPKMEITGSDQTGRKMVNMDTGEVVKDGITAPVAPTTGDLTELSRVNAERVGRGEQPLTAEEWLKQRDERKASKITVNSGDSALDTGFAKTYVDDFSKADNANSTIRSVTAAREALDKGIIAGSVLSPYELEGRKVLANIFGIPDSATSSTETFLSQMREVTLGKISALGSGTAISDNDRKYMDDVVAGSISLTPQAIRKVLAIQEKYARNAIRKYNNNIDELASKDTEGKLKYLRKVQPEAFSASPEAIERLKSDPTPETIKMFNDYYGDGTAEEVLGAH